MKRKRGTRACDLCPLSLNLSNRKRSQVTIFVIIAVLIVAAGLLTFISIKNMNKSDTSGDPVYVYVQNCLDGVFEQAIWTVGEQGGYYTNFPEDGVLYSFPYLVPVYINRKIKDIPTKETVEKEINNYVQENIVDCLADFEEFKQEGFEIELTEVIANSEIETNRITLNMKSDLVVSKGEVKEEFKEFKSEIKKIRIPELLKLSNEIIKEQTKDPRTVCITCLSDFADKYKVKINAYETSNRNEFVYVITDPLSNFTSENEVGIPYNWSFGARYDFPDCDTTEECFRALS